MKEKYELGYATFTDDAKSFSFGMDCAWSIGIWDESADEELWVGGGDDGKHSITWCKLFGLGAAIISGLYDEDLETIVAIAKEMRDEHKTFTLSEIQERLLVNVKDEI